MAPPNTLRRGGGKGRGRGRPPSGDSQTTDARTTSKSLPAKGQEKQQQSSGRNKQNITSSHNTSTRSANTNSNANLLARGARRSVLSINSTIPKKVVIRKIPHDVTEDDLLLILEKYSISKDYVWRFSPGKVHGSNRPPSTGCLYLLFRKNPELAQKVVNTLDGYVISETKSDQRALEVDFAPYQKLPREKSRNDSKSGSIDRDPDYLAFMAELAKPKEKLPSADIAVDAIDSGSTTEKPIATLVQYLNERKSQNREKNKGKAVGKSYDKGQARRQSKKKEKKAKAKEKKSASTSTSKSSRKNRSSRAAKAENGRNTNANDPGTGVQPGMVKIMGSNASGNTALPAEQKKSSRSAGNVNEPTQKASGGKGKRSKSRREKETNENDPKNSSALQPDAETKTRKKISRNSHNVRKDSNATGGTGKSSDRKRKIFLPKDPSGGSIG